MKTFVRTVVRADIPEIKRIADESGLSHWTRQGYFDEIDRPDSIFLTVATGDDGIVGFILGRIVPGPDAEIYNIAVEKNTRRHRLGHVLLSEFISRCKTKHIVNIWLEVRQSNANAISFYTNAGFEEISVRPRFYADPIEDAVVMRLAIRRT